MATLYLLTWIHTIHITTAALLVCVAVHTLSRNSPSLFQVPSELTASALQNLVHCRVCLEAVLLPVSLPVVADELHTLYP